MKVIDLLNDINNLENMPKEIKVDGHYLKYDNIEKFYQTEDKIDLLEIGKEYSTYDFLNFNVETVNKDEIDDEIDIDSIEECKLEKYIINEFPSNTDEYLGNKINELIKAVKNLNKKIGDNK